MAIICWRSALTQEMEMYGESWADVESHTLTDEQLDQKFSSNFGNPEGVPFTLWTRKRVYFPIEYDGAEKAASIARHPDGRPTPHIGLFYPED